MPNETGGISLEAFKDLVNSASSNGSQQIIIVSAPFASLIKQYQNNDATQAVEFANEKNIEILIIPDPKSTKEWKKIKKDEDVFISNMYESYDG